jgi:hypothetical protein
MKTTPIHKLGLTYYQGKIFQSPARFKYAKCGRRFGKSFVSAITMIYKAEAWENQNIWYVTTTYDQAKELMRKRLLDLIPRGYLKKEPPNSGRIKFEFKDRPIYDTNGNFVRMKIGSTISLFGAQNKDNLVGSGVDFLVLDEVQSILPEVWYQALRPALADTKGSALLIGTSRGKGSWCQDLEASDEFETFIFNTHQGGVVDRDEIEQMRRDMDEATFEQEILSKDVSRAGVVVYQITKNNDWKTNVTFDRLADTVLSWDFNVGLAPMTCTLFQKDRTNPDRHNAVMEFVHYNSTTEPSGLAVKDWLTEQKFNGRLEITGDFSGKARNPASPTTSWRILEGIFGDYPGFKKTVRRTLTVQDSINHANQALKSGTVKINPKTCPKLVRDCYSCEWKDNGKEIDSKGEKRGHQVDNLKDFCYNYKLFGETLKISTL